MKYALWILPLLAAAVAAQTQETGAPLRAGSAAGESAVNPRDGGRVVWVPAGQFTQGSTDGEADERPPRKVTISRGFWVYEAEITNAQYGKYLEANPGRPKPQFWDDPRFNAPDQPVVGIGWEEATAFARWAGGRLPTEAEWEYTARGPENRSFPWGRENPNPEFAVFGKDFKMDRPAPVGSHTAGASWCNALDMAGNVWEWTADAYGPYSGDAVTDPQGVGAGKERVVRGGCWAHDPKEMRGANREKLQTGCRDRVLGFRIVVPVP